MKFPSAHYDRITGKTRSKADAAPMTFGRLPVGQVFDFVSGTPADSFFLRCVKLSARKYGIAGDVARPDCERITYRIGSIHAKVYHVGPQP